MAHMVKKAGTELQTGATASGIEGVHTQTSGKKAAGELRIIRDENGDELAAYVVDPHKEMNFEAVLAKQHTDHEIGDIISIASQRYLVTQWDVSETNDDTKKVSIGLRSTTLSAPNPSQAAS